MTPKELGFDISLLAAGLFGALLMTGRDSAANRGRTLVSLIGGAMSANYLTPVVTQFAKVASVQMEHAIAFLLGFCGLKAVEKIAVHFMPNEPTNRRERRR
jgi:hypothetical protein